ncbi:glycine/D-amino acid oxidase-like deaminating enzyme [Pontibacter ummariensis]|uniref:Glycine/D-amino acid oxidase n=1 Tax=Pontibacter ummariensis TaxID=1610492 RepID=A0A239DSS2_9BACT|nr:FAD-dependent oxidoreductase [Pontibacter ummariensis]PRY13800.1 glycine/D-amino acid oxidase-like deaminating enzyme [Pontibacter ummariensis]SNS34793.1 Glycine/D-amino acid oxidase [Pontibacter ummariensis]
MATEHYYTQAIWSATAGAKTYPSLSHDLEVDVAVIGGGITGITTAYNLAKAGKKVAVLEAKRVGMGTTGSSTGNLYAPTGQLHKVASKHNEETMKAVAFSRSGAVDFIEEVVNEFNIDCGFRRVPWYYFTTKEDSPHNKQIEKELLAAIEAGLPATGVAPAGFPYRVSRIANVAHQAQFNPLQYVQQLAAAIAGESCRIFEQTKVLDVEDGEPCVVHTSHGKVTAKAVIKATHSPIGRYVVHTEMEVHREYALAVRLKGDLPPDGIYWHMEEKQMYSVRPYSTEEGNFLLVLDASHKIGHVEQTEKSFKRVEEYLRAHFEVDEIAFTWAAQNYKPADGLPYIGTSFTEENVYMATGFAADGLTWGTLASIMIGDALFGRESPWASFYDPKRFTPAASAKRFLKENKDVVTHLVKDYLLRGDEKELDEIKPGEGKVVALEDGKVAAFRDEQGQLHVVSAVCTHMGCLVHWNNGEKSWDCPCHGSRFSVDGQVLEGPAIENLEEKGAGGQGPE